MMVFNYINIIIGKRGLIEYKWYLNNASIDIDTHYDI